MTKSNMDASYFNVSKWQTPHLLDNHNGLVDTPRTDEEIRKQAYEESYVKGYQAGLEKGQEKIKQQLELLNNFISLLSSPFHDMNHQIAEELAELAGKIARGLVKRELKTDPETIVAIVRDSVKALAGNTRKVTVSLHPEDAQILNDINRRVTEKPLWNVKEDPLLSRGDCKVSNGKSLVDENIQSRINLIITQFLGDDRNEHNAQTE